MSLSPDYDSYAAKMRSLALAGSDLETAARFVDMLCPRQARILDIGCGIGSSVNALRRQGHQAFGIDPTAQVLQVAGELYRPSWFRNLSAAQLCAQSLAAQNLPARYEAILLAGNVPAFLSPAEYHAVFTMADELLSDSGVLVIGTSTQAAGGPADQDELVRNSALRQLQRHADWHAAAYTEQSPWSVTVYARSLRRSGFQPPDGIFVLPA